MKTLVCVESPTNTTLLVHQVASGLAVTFVGCKNNGRDDPAEEIAPSGHLHADGFVRQPGQTYAAAFSFDTTLTFFFQKENTILTLACDL